MTLLRWIRHGMWLALGWAGRCDAVIFLDTADPQHHTSTPGDNSGWQYEGRFSSYLGVPIAPYFFITAKHFGGVVGSVFDFHGDSYTTIGFQDIPATDLRIWQVAAWQTIPDLCAAFQRDGRHRRHRHGDRPRNPARRPKSWCPAKRKAGNGEPVTRSNAGAETP